MFVLYKTLLIIKKKDFFIFTVILVFIDYGLLKQEPRSLNSNEKTIFLSCCT